MKTLENYIKRTISIPETALGDIVHSFQSMPIEKNTHLITVGQYCDNYYFVESGLLRIYTVVNGKEITGWFASQGTFFTELESYTYQCKSKFNIQAIEHGILLYISRRNMNALLEKYAAWGELVRKTWELAFMKLSQVVLTFHSLSVKDRSEHSSGASVLIQKPSQSDEETDPGVINMPLSYLKKKP